MRAKIGALTDRRLVECYVISAKTFEASPQGPDADAHLTILGMMDLETLRRDMPCCDDCSVPLAADWHAKSMHDAESPTNRLAAAIVDTALASTKEI